MKHILFIVSEDWYFISHRLHLATTAIEKGFSVTLLTNVSKNRSLIEASGVKVIDWRINRSGLNVFLDIKAILRIFHVIRQCNPDIVHSVAIKPVVYSALVSMMSSVKIRIFALGGLGFSFSSNKTLMKLVRPLLIVVLRLLLKGPRTRLILQNQDDIELFLRKKIIIIDKVRLIRGAGVDTQKYCPNKLDNDPALVILPARMLWDKGISEFVTCAKQFKENGINTRFCLIGSPDKYNPESIPLQKLKEWSDEGIVEWWGQQDDMNKVYSQSAIVCFPSYREGLPKSLLEAASCGLPIVAFDVPGCREIIKDGVNGFLVPFKDTDALYSAILKLLNDSNLRDSMGHSGRELVIKEFSKEIIASQTMKVWNEAFE